MGLPFLLFSVEGIQQIALIHSCVPAVLGARDAALGSGSQASSARCV